MNMLNLLPKIMLLQIFAEPNTQVTDMPGLSPEMKVFYRTQLLREAAPNLVHQQFAKKVNMPANNGKEVEWRRFSVFKKAMKPLVEGVTPEGTPFNVRAISKKLDQYGDYTTISDLLQLTAVDPIITEITDKHAANMGLTLDALTRNEMLTCPNVFFAPKTAENGTETEIQLRAELEEGCKLTPKMFAKAAAFLKQQNAPKIDGAYTAILHPFVEYDMLVNDKGWVDVVKYKDSQKVYEGEIGMLYGIRVVITSEAKVYKGAPLTEASETVTAGAALALSNGAGVSSLTLDTAIAAGDRLMQASAMEPVLLNVNGVEFECVGATAGAAGTAKLSIQQPHAAISDNAVIWPGGAGKNNTPVFPVLIFGANAYGALNVSGDAAHVIVKPKGSGGTEDPLDQRSSVGWKAFFAAKVLMEEYMLRMEVCSELGDMISEEN